MKRFFTFILCAVLTVSGGLAFAGCGCADNSIIVQTNAYFAPFEYYDGTTIKGVDIDIMNLVGEKLDKKVEFVNVEFDVIIDNVAAGKVCDVGAAGITITPQRAEQVDFSTPYYSSVQYVIFKTSNSALGDAVLQDGDTDYILWDSLKGLKIGVQRNTTGHFFVEYEIDEGVLADSDAALEPRDTAQEAVDSINANHVDVVVVDMMPAQFITDKNSGYSCVALYYAGEDGEADYPTEESYAICVTKGNTELLNAINEVLAELGDEGIEDLVKKHMGLVD